MVSLIVHLGTIVQAFVGGHVDLAGEDLQTDRREQGLMNSQPNGLSMVVTDRHDEVDIGDGAVIVLVLETAAKGLTQTMPMARTMVVPMTIKEGNLRHSRETEEVLVSGESGKDLRKTWNDRDLRTEELVGSLCAVAGVVDVDLVEEGEALIDQERETTIDIPKGVYVCC